MSEPDEDREICTDFKEDNCRKGQNEEARSSNEHLAFCSDFRETVCRDRHCSKLHGSSAVQKEYLETGWLPLDMQEKIIKEYGLCYRFLTEGCDREDCKFEHKSLGMDLKGVWRRQKGPRNGTIDDVIYACGVCTDFTLGSCTRTACKYNHKGPAECGVGNRKTLWIDVRKREEEERRERGVKRRKFFDSAMESYGGMGSSAHMEDMRNVLNMRGMGGSMTGMRNSGGEGNAGPNMRVMGELEEILSLKVRITELQTENDSLKKKNDQLKATNQFLLEENAEMRMARKASERSSEGSYDADRNTIDEGRY